MCCLLVQTNGNSSPELNLLEKTEHLVDNYVYGDFNPVLWSSDNSYRNTQFWNKVSDFFNYKFKMLEFFVSNTNWKNYDEIKFQNVSLMPRQQLFSKYANRKIEKNIPKRIPRNINITQANTTVIQQSTAFSSEPSVLTKEIKNNISTITSTNQSLIYSTKISTTLNANTDSSSIIYSTPMTTAKLPSISSITEIDNQVFQNNIINKDKIKILSDTLSYERKFFFFNTISTIIMIIILIIFRKLLCYSSYFSGYNNHTSHR